MRLEPGLHARAIIDRQIATEDLASRERSRQFFALNPQPCRGIGHPHRLVGVSQGRISSGLEVNAGSIDGELHPAEAQSEAQPEVLRPAGRVGQSSVDARHPGRACHVAPESGTPGKGLRSGGRGQGQGRGPWGGRQASPGAPLPDAHADRGVSGSGRVGVKRMVQRQRRHGQLLGPEVESAAHQEQGHHRLHRSGKEGLESLHRMRVMGPVHSASKAGSETRMW